MNDEHHHACVSLETHLLALRNADRDLLTERDRRYTELAEEREKRLSAAQEEVRAWRAQANEWRSAMTDREKRFITVGGVMGLIGAAAAVISIIVALRH